MRTITFKQDYKDKQGNQFKAGDSVMLIGKTAGTDNFCDIARYTDPKRKAIPVPERYLNL